jgi:hypothetical protein
MIMNHNYLFLCCFAISFKYANYQLNMLITLFGSYAYLCYIWGIDVFTDVFTEYMKIKKLNYASNRPNLYFESTAKMTLDGRHPVKLAITHKGQRKYYSLKDKIKDDSWLFISKDDIKCIWPPLKNGSPVNPRGILRDIRNEYDRIVKGRRGYY